LASVRNALIKLGHEAVISSSPEQILQADRVVLPGVGAFGDAMNNLSRLGLDKTVKQVIASGTRLLGICLGLQLLFTEGEEHGIHPGLGIIKGQVKKFNLPRPYKVPHMGWNI
jgi:glutamine amidotransferase